MDRERESEFEEIKKSIALANTLINSNFERDFILYTLGGELSIYVILTQLNHKIEEKTISFFS